MVERTITFPDDLKPKWVDRFVKDVQAHIRGARSGNETYPAPHHGWICFHCGERFTTKEGAALHFGTLNDDRPLCIERLHKWVYATARSLADSGLSLEEYNTITHDVVDQFRPLTAGQRDAS